MPTACDNIACDTDLENLLIKINSYLTRLEEVEALCASAKMACENRVASLEDEIDGFDDKIALEIRTLKDFLLEEIKKVSDCACGLKTDVTSISETVKQIIEKLKVTYGVTIENGVLTKYANVWTPSDGGDVMISGTQIKDGTVTGIKIADGAITPDKLVRNELVKMGNFAVSGDTTTVASTADVLSASNTGIVGSHTLTNTSSVDMQTMFILSGRSGAQNVTDVDQLQTFIVIIGGAVVFSYGWTPTMQDSKNANFFYTVPANGSITIDIRTAKTSADGTTTFGASVGYVGIKN